MIRIVERAAGRPSPSMPWCAPRTICSAPSARSARRSTSKAGARFARAAPRPGPARGRRGRHHRCRRPGGRVRAARRDPGRGPTAHPRHCPPRADLGLASGRGLAAHDRRRRTLRPRVCRRAEAALALVETFRDRPRATGFPAELHIVIDHPEQRGVGGAVPRQRQSDEPADRSRPSSWPAWVGRARLAGGAALSRRPDAARARPAGRCRPAPPFMPSDWGSASTASPR